MATTLQLLRRAAFARQHGHCYYCGLPIWETHGKAFSKRLGIPKKLARHSRCTAEHLRARQEGGRDEPSNIVAACAWCNWNRHANGASSAPNPELHRTQVRRQVLLGEWHPLAAFWSHPLVRHSEARRRPGAPHGLRCWADPPSVVL